MHCLLPSRGNSTNPERPPACNRRRRSNSCKPSASFLPAWVDAMRHLVNTRPRMPVADFAPRGRAAADRIMSAYQRPSGVGYHDGNSHCAFLTQSPRTSACGLRKTKRQDGIMTSAATWRIWSDVGIHWCANNWAGAKPLQSCAPQHVVQHKSPARLGRR